MKAIVCRKISDDIATLRLEEVELPPLQPHEARAAAVNFPDILMVQGKYQHRPTLPFTPGTEAAGDVVAVGNAVTNVQVGDRVICTGLGCFAQEMQVPAIGLHKIPSQVDYAHAAGFSVAYITAYVALVRRSGKVVILQTDGKVVENALYGRPRQMRGESYYRFSSHS